FEDEVWLLCTSLELRMSLIWKAWVFTYQTWCGRGVLHEKDRSRYRCLRRGRQLGRMRGQGPDRQRQRQGAGARRDQGLKATLDWRPVLKIGPPFLFLPRA